MACRHGGLRTWWSQTPVSRCEHDRLHRDMAQLDPLAVQYSLNVLYTLELCAVEGIHVPPLTNTH